MGVQLTSSAYIEVKGLFLMSSGLLLRPDINGLGSRAEDEKSRNASYSEEEYVNAVEDSV
jgi:hypothetical protein